MIRFENIFAYLYDSQNRLRKAKKEASFKRAMLEFGLYGINVGVLASVGVVVLMQDLNGGVGLDRATWNAAHAIWALGPGALILIPLIGALTSIVVLSLACIFLGLSSRVLGGNGSFKENAYLVSRLIFPFSLATIAIGFVSQLPFFGTVIPFLWIVYALWIMVNVIHIANNIPIEKAAIILALLIGTAGSIASLV
ncbi:MAG: Yip1 family protein [archaeon]